MEKSEKKGVGPKRPTSRVHKASAYDEEGREAVRFFDRGPIMVLIDPIPRPLFLNRLQHCATISTQSPH